MVAGRNIFSQKYTSYILLYLLNYRKSKGGEEGFHFVQNVPSARHFQPSKQYVRVI
jgi:hypothetical protein